MASPKSNDSRQTTSEEDRTLAVAKEVCALRPAYPIQHDDESLGSGVAVAHVAEFLNKRVTTGGAINYDDMRVFFSLVFGKPSDAVALVMNECLKKERRLAARACERNDREAASAHESNATLEAQLLQKLLNTVADEVVRGCSDPLARHSSKTREQYDRLADALQVIDDDIMREFISANLLRWLFVGVPGSYRYCFVDGAKTGLVTAVLANTGLDRDALIGALSSVAGSINQFEGTNAVLLRELATFATEGIRQTETVQSE